jgi:hypothetical protein
MPVPNKVTRKLGETLGADAGDAMSDWMNQSEETTRELRADIAELRQELRAGLADVRQEMRVGFANVDAKFASVDAKFASVDAKFAAAEAAAAKRHADFMKWLLGFWALSLITIVGAIATLSRMLP